MSLRKNTLWNLAGSGLPLLAAAALIPFTLNRLGNEAFGVLTLIWALIGYFSLFDMGVGRALTYELSKLRGNSNQPNQHAEISLTLKAGLLLTLATGVFGAALMLLLAPSLATNWLKISPALQQDAMHAFQIAAIGIIPTTLTSGLRGALEGLERFAGSNVNKLILGFCMFALPALAIVLHGNQLSIIALYLVVSRILVTLLALTQLREYLFTLQNAESRSLFRSNIKERVKPLFNYGIWMTLSSIISPLMVYGDRFFVSAAVGATLLPIYAIPQEGLQRLLIIPAALCGALLPQLVVSSSKTATDLYWRTLKHVALVMLAICFTTAISIHTILAIWLNKEFASAALTISIILCVGIWMNSMAIVPYTYLHSKGDTKATAVLHTAEFVIYIATLYFLVTKYGLIGAALAWVLRVGIDLIMLHYLVAKKHLAS